MEPTEEELERAKNSVKDKWYRYGKPAGINSLVWHQWLAYKTQAHLTKANERIAELEKEIREIVEEKEQAEYYRDEAQEDNAKFKSLAESMRERAAKMLKNDAMKLIGGKSRVSNVDAHVAQILSLKADQISNLPLEEKGR